MLEQFIESKSNKTENRRSRRFLFSTFSVLTVFCVSAVVWSLFSRDLVLASDNLEFSTLVTPVAEIEPVKKDEEIESDNKPKSDTQSKVQTPTRVIDLSRVEDNFVPPEKVSTIPNSFKERPRSGKFNLSNYDLDPIVGSNGPNLRPIGTGRTISDPAKTRVIPKVIPIDEEVPPIVEKRKIVEKATTKPPVVSLGVANGKAISLVKPLYSAAAKAIGASGSVSVQISIDENGNVTSANATSGHPIFRADCERAARSTKFSPTFLSKIPVKASGVLTYNFIR